MAAGVIVTPFYTVGWRLEKEEDKLLPESTEGSHFAVGLN